MTVGTRLASQSEVFYVIWSSSGPPPGITLSTYRTDITKKSGQSGTDLTKFKMLSTRLTD